MPPIQRACRTPGYTGNDVGSYVRHHAPWVNFSDVPVTDNLPFSKFPRHFNELPTVSFVVPNLANDMHSGTVERADRWLKQHMSRYAAWAKKNNSLLIVTWDEDNGTSANHIPTIFYGAHIRRGPDSEPVNHYNVLRTIEDMYALPPLGNAASAMPITGVFAERIYVFLSAAKNLAPNLTSRCSFVGASSNTYAKPGTA